MIEVSPREKDSASRSVAETLAVMRLTDLYPSAKLMRRDLAPEHLPHLDEIHARGRYLDKGPGRGGEF
jgi:FMN-dependent NADH-azoreductase